MKADQQAKIEDALFGEQFPIRLDKEKFTATFMPQGKSSDVFKVELPGNKITYAIKIFNPEQWQAREIDIYEKYLTVSALGTPELVFASKPKGILVLSWIKASVSNLEFNQLANWLTSKYSYFIALFEGQSIDIGKNIGWMLLDPISKVSQSVGFSSIEVVQAVIRNKDLIRDRLLEAYDLPLPIVLDHADLELQNIISSDNAIYVIDWANAVKSLGFIDFAQFKKLLREADQMDLYESYEQTFSRLLGMELRELAHMVSLFAVIREIQLLAYYQGSDVDMQDPRITSSVAVLQAELGLLLG